MQETLANVLMTGFGAAVIAVDAYYLFTGRWRDVFQQRDRSGSANDAESDRAGRITPKGG